MSHGNSHQSSARLACTLLGFGLLSLSWACGSDDAPVGSNGGSSTAGGASGGSAPVGGGGSSVGGSSSGSSSGGGAVNPQGGSNSAAGSASGGAAAGSSSGGVASTGGAGPTACAFQCVDQCGATTGTARDGACTGTQVCCEPAQANPLAHLVPSAKEVGLLLANRFSKQALAYSSVANLPGDGYKTACEWYGALGVAKLTSSSELVTTLVTKFDPLKTNFVSAMKGGEAHVDRYIYGMVPLEIYLQTADASYLPLGVEVAEGQQTTNQTRGAIDDMFMMTGLQLEAYRAVKKSGDAAKADKFINFMAKTMVDYLKPPAQKENGLFFHNEVEGKVHWGRGNGWFAAGMAEIMRDLPTTAAEYPTIEAGYKKMMDGLLKFQGKNGLWYQVLDMPDNASNWEETSGTAMFTYAMIAGVRRGVLDAAKFVPAIDAAWAGIKTKIAANGDVSGICVGTWYKPNAAEYMALTRLTGDGHGQAPVLWAAAELLR